MVLFTVPPFYNWNDCYFSYAEPAEQNQQQFSDQTDFIIFLLG